MIILDTNVLSALMRATPDAVMIGWLDAQPSESIWITSVTLFEIRFGLALLPRSKRRQTLETVFEQLLVEDLGNRICDFDRAAASAAAALAAARQRAGRSVDMRDTQIAGIVLARRAALATRNVKHFEDIDVPLINPWEPLKVRRS